MSSSNPLFDEQFQDEVKRYERETLHGITPASLKNMSHSGSGNPNASREVSSTTWSGKLHALEYLRKLRRKRRSKESHSFLEGQMPQSSPSTSSSVNTPRPSISQMQNPDSGDDLAVTHSPTNTKGKGRPTASFISESEVSLLSQQLQQIGVSHAQLTNSNSTSTTDTVLEGKSISPHQHAPSTYPTSGRDPPHRNSTWTTLNQLINRKAARPESLRSQRLSLISDGSSVMLYSPLIIDDAPEVEVGRSEIRSICLDDGSDVHQPDPAAELTTSRPIGDGDACTIPKSEESATVQEVHLWMPSGTKMSLQITWWGYRLYLPPPVLEVLNDKQLEAAKRAAIITVALKWLLEHIPTAALPLQFHWITLLLSGLIPIVSYIGGFIAWSWTTVKSFDRGNGVILSATWLLPVLLIPGTWHQDRN